MLADRRMPHRNPLNDPLPRATRDIYTAQTRARHDFADWLATRLPHAHTTRPERALLDYMRASGLWPVNARWSESKRSELIIRFGTNCYEWLKRSVAMPTDELITRLRRYREDSDPDVRPAVHTYVRSPNPVPEPVEEGPSIALLYRAMHLENRQMFVEFLESRNGACNPQRMYRQWRREVYERQLKPHTRLKVDAPDVLGAAATAVLLDKKYAGISRQDLAQLIRRIP